MSLDLDRLEQRVVGVLIEKELTVPEAYPLTLNALVLGCNQKSNRDPFLQVEEYEVEGAVRALMDRGWVRRHERDGARTHRFTHEARTQLGVDEADLALLCELLCRGPQAPGALKTRAERMHPFASPEEVERRLEALAARPVPYVERLPRAPRERQARWAHRLGPREGATEAGPGPAAPPAAAPRPGPAGDAPPAAAPGGGWEEERLAVLEEALVELRERVERLERRLG